VLNNWWLNNVMRKVYFHNGKSIDQNINTKRLSEAQHVSEKQVVDINKLLNRVKIDQKNETKRKIIFYSFIILGLSLLGTLITVLK
jgi:preprotein translocase subunit SecA